MILPIVIANPIYMLVKKLPVVWFLRYIEYIVMSRVFLLQKPSNLSDIIPPESLWSCCWIAHYNNSVHADIGKVNVKAIIFKPLSWTTHFLSYGINEDTHFIFFLNNIII